jgi:Acyl-CoA thioesterase C-terminal domain/Acyl-CoA thioesterase N-terminal domain
MSDAFFIPDGEEAFMATPLTRGPWDPGSQHAGPPSALIGRELERCEPRDEMRIARVTFDILRPVPIATLSVEARVVRPGRSVELLEATLRDEAGTDLVRATAWRIRTSDTGLEAREQAPPPGPEEGAHRPFFPTGHDVGYHTGMEYRFVTGAYLEPGPATVWMRALVPLVAGEEMTPLQRVLVAADSGNGVSAALDFRDHLFINCDLTVHLARHPADEWVCLDAVTQPEPDGVGIADTALYDRRGKIGRAVQSLLVAKRG